MKFMVVLVVLLALQTPTLAVGTFEIWERSEHVGARGNFEEGIAVEILHYDHIDSPYATPNSTLNQRIVMAVKSSQARLQYLEKRIYGKSLSVNFTDLVYMSPVYSDQSSYLMVINVGTPPRKFFAIVDTGSDLIWVQCAPCVSCYSQIDAIFVPSASSSYRTRSCIGDALCSALPRIPQPCSAQKTCLYQYGYGDQSTTQGDFASETFTLISTTGAAQPFFPIGFGCGHKNQGTFSPADGLVGFGLGPLSLPSQLGAKINNIFSYCLVDFYASGSTSSTLLLGATGSAALKYTPLVWNPANPSFYYVTLTGIVVGGVPLVYPPSAFAITSSGAGGVILDSGTTITYLDIRAYRPFVNRIVSLVPYPQVDGSTYGFDLCYDFSGVANPIVPSVTFRFLRVNVDLPANNIFVQVDTGPIVCLAFGGSSGLSIYGAFQQQNFQIAYDSKKRIVGFAPKTC